MQKTTEKSCNGRTKSTERGNNGKVTMSEYEAVDILKMHQPFGNDNVSDQLFEAMEIAIHALQDSHSQITIDPDDIVRFLSDLKSEFVCAKLDCRKCEYRLQCMNGEMSFKIAIDKTIAYIKNKIAAV